MENKEKLTQEQEQALNYIWNTITPTKNYDAELKENDRFNQIMEVVAEQNGVLVARPKMDLKKLETISLVLRANNITINDLLLKKYYIAEFKDGNYQLFKKYTSVVEDFKKENPHILVEFYIENDNFVECILTDTKNNTQIKNKCFWSEAQKTSRPKIDFLRSKAFKDILRYNYPKYVEFYDENDEDVIKYQEQPNNKQDKATTNELFKKLQAKIGE